jgi:hypothetical protein
MQIPSHAIGLDVALQLSIFQIDTKGFTCPILIAKRPRLEHNVLQTTAMEKSRESLFGGDLAPHQNETLHFV